MQSRDYVFKEIGGAKVEVSAFWKPGRTAPYGIGM